jgi:hypothetical protein
VQNLIDEGPYEKVQKDPLDAYKAVNCVVKNLTKLTFVANDPEKLSEWLDGEIRRIHVDSWK